MKFIRVITVIFLFLLTFSVFAGGNKEVPDLEVATSGTQYISPDGNGIKDNAELSFKVKLYVKSKKGYVPLYGLRIKDKSGNIIKEVLAKEKSDINWFIRIFTKYSEFTLEKTVKWDGFDNAGNKVPDGVYNVDMWVKDSSGNIRETAIDDFVVDIIAPDVELVKPDKMIFSPNNDGNLDNISIEQKNSTNETLWEGEIVSGEGKTVRKFKWENTVLPAMVWDGKDDFGKAADDGVYSYRINSTDLAGNKMDEKNVEGIVLDTTMADIVFELSDQYFSPNGDGIKDTITVTFGQNTEKGLTGWAVTMADKSGKIILSHEGVEAGIYEAVIDGNGAQGEKLPEGSYNVGFSSEYENGVRIVKNESVYLDITPPAVKFNVENPVFSPNGNGSKDTTEISMKSNKIVNWSGAITNSEGDVIVETSSKDTTSLVVWDGKDQDGEDLPDGDYYLETYFEDLAGNPLKPEKQKIVIDRNDKKAYLVNIPGAERDERGLEGIAFFSVESDYKDGIDRWSFNVKDGEGNILYEDAGSETLPDMITVEGDPSDADEGTYRVSFEAVYTNGSVSRDEFDFFHDLTPPVVSVDITSTPFAVNGRELEGEVDIVPFVEDESGIYSWSMDIIYSGNKIDTINGKEVPGDGIKWYGKGSTSERAESKKEFTASLSITDMNGNTAAMDSNFSIDIIAYVENGKYYLMVPDIIFSAYKSSLDSRGRETGEKNLQTVKKVSELFKKYPEYTIVLEGHALNVFQGTSSAKEKKEEGVLLPLTQKRAESVRKALIREGVPEDKIVIEYFGGKFPVEPVKDMKNRWKNRRVEFVIKN